MSELKPCPFCGSKAKYMEIRGIVISRFVTCTKCGIETKRNYLTRKRAIEDWNRREPMENIAKKIISAIDEASFEFNDGTDCVRCVFKEKCDTGFDGCVETMMDVCRSIVVKAVQHDY